jgi:hypothetical protein
MGLRFVQIIIVEITLDHLFMIAARSIVQYIHLGHLVCIQLQVALFITKAQLVKGLFVPQHHLISVHHQALVAMVFETFAKI